MTPCAPGWHCFNHDADLRPYGLCTLCGVSLKDVTRQPLLDRAVGWLTGKAIVWYGKRAFDRGDTHEYQHCIAALIHGNSDHSKTPCTLRETASVYPPEMPLVGPSDPGSISH